MDAPEVLPFAAGNAYHTIMLQGAVLNVGMNNPYVILTAHDASGSICITYDELVVMIAKQFAEQQRVEAKAAEMIAKQNPITTAQLIAKSNERIDRDNARPSGVGPGKRGK